MLDDLFVLSRHFLKTLDRKYIRYFLKKYNLDSRFIIIIGQRGVGKTTAIIQHILFKYDIQSTKVLYIQVDHFKFGRRTLYETAEEFYNLGGELLCFDEIHKYNGWARELKSINDSFPKLKLIASGSSAMEILKQSYDLSRRAIVRRMNGLSFREYVDLKFNLELQSFTIEQIIQNHEKIALDLVIRMDKKDQKVLALFKDYLQVGYYPYFLEFKEPSLYFIALEQGVHATIESDLLTIYPSLTGASINKIKKLLSVIAVSVPFIPDFKKLKRIVEVSDERTLKNYLKYLEDGGIIQILSKRTKLSEIEKPGKIYLNNPNQIFALSSKAMENIGNTRETFFLNMLSSIHKVILPKYGDFLVDNKYTFEVGGRNKTFGQIKDVPNSFLAVDDLETGFGNKIPLWLFGFLY